MTEITATDSCPPSGERTFDFSTHSKTAADSFHRVRNRYADLAESAREIVEQCMCEANIHVLSVQARAKDVASFERKAATPSEVDPNVPKYADPLHDITDLAGLRVITFFPRTIADVDQILSAEFDIVEKSDKSTELKKDDRFGYQSIHYLARLSSKRTGLPEYSRLTDMIFEVQVRTVLQHAWAEIEHDIQYKAVSTIPSHIRRRFGALAGLLEIADREFQAIQDEDDRLRREARESVAEGRLGEVELTPDALKAYLDRRLGPDGRVTMFSYQHAAAMLRAIGFSNLLQIDSCIGGYDDDAISRLMWGTRQGQLTRLEGVMLAGMGDGYVRRHPWGIFPWFMKGSVDRLGRLRSFGVEIGSYVPTPDILDGRSVVLSFAIDNYRNGHTLDMPDQVSQLLAVLPPIEARVVALAFGLGVAESHQLESIGALLGVVVSTVEMLLRSAMDRLESVGAGLLAADRPSQPES